MNCAKIQELLSAFHDRQLSEDLCIEVQKHLGECSECAKELVRFEKLTSMAGDLTSPNPSQAIWQRIEQGLDQPVSSEKPCPDQPAPAMPSLTRGKFRLATKPFALAATLLVALGVGYVVYQVSVGHDHHQEFAAEFNHYVDVFSHDADEAQQILFTKYSNQSVDQDQVIQQVGYRPAVAEGLPDGYTLESTHVMKMPCCTCVHSVCKRRDGSTMAIFEHDDESCADKQCCCLVEVNHPIAASWKRGTRHITLIGVRNAAEINDMVAWWDRKNDPAPN